MPSGPLPTTPARSTPRSRAYLRTGGLARGAGGSADTSGTGSGSAAARRRRRDATGSSRGPYPTRFGSSPSVPSSISTIAVPTSTVAPSGTSRLLTVPANGDGNSTSDFAVSISTSTSLTSTSWPASTRQETISASRSPSPGSGNRNWRFIFHLPQKARERSTASRMRSADGRNSRSTRAGG